MSGLPANQRNREDDPPVSENIRRYINRKTLFAFTPEGKHQIALLEEQLYDLKLKRQAILEKESELIYFLHDLILQEKYLQLQEEKTELADKAVEIMSPQDKERLNAISEGMSKIMERREIMAKDQEVERLREKEEESEQEEDVDKMKEEWNMLKMPGHDSITLNMEDKLTDDTVQPKLPTPRGRCTVL